MSPASGFAAAQDGKIMIRTVTDTKVNAAINWLVLVVNAAIPHGVTDETVLEAFDHYAPHLKAELVPVTVGLQLEIT